MLGIFIRARKRNHRAKEIKRNIEHKMRKRQQASYNIDDFERYLEKRRSFIEKHFKKPRPLFEITQQEKLGYVKFKQRQEKKLNKSIKKAQNKIQSNHIISEIQNYVTKDLKAFKEKFDIITGQKSICEQRKEKKREIMRNTKGKGLSIKFASTDQLLRSIICRKK